MRRINYTAACVLLAVIVQAGCAKRAEPDAYGNVEATEVVVGAEATGRAQRQHVNAGRRHEYGVLPLRRK